MSRGTVRLLTGSVAVAVVTAVIAGAVVLFRGGGAATTVSVTVISPRAGLVLNPEAKVKLHGAQVGKVVSIDSLPDGQAAIRLAMNPADLSLIPANTFAQIASSTVFGAKFVDLVPPKTLAGHDVCGSSPRRPARNRGDQHGVRTIGDGAGPDSARKAQRNTRGRWRKPSTGAGTSSDRPWPTLAPCWSRSIQACPH